MIILTNLLKSKFISKKMVNGKWVYTYNIPKNIIKMKPKINQEYINKSIRKVADNIMKITNNKYEMGSGLSSNGKLFFSRKGEEEQVNFTRKEFQQLKNGIVVHNHPNNSSFSPDDLALAILEESSESVVVTNKKIYKYKSPKNGLLKYRNIIEKHNKTNQIKYSSKDTDGVFDYMMAEVLAPIEEKIFQDLMYKVYTKEITKDEAFFKHLIMVGEEFAKITGGIYTVEDR